MSVISGKNGTVKIGSNTVSEVKQWKATAKSNNPSFATNAFPGYTRRVAGVKDYEGTLTVIDDPAGTLDEGTEVTLILNKDATTTWKTIPAIIDSYDILVDIDKGEPVAWEIKWSANGQPS